MRRLILAFMWCIAGAGLFALLAGDVYAPPGPAPRPDPPPRILLR